MLAPTGTTQSFEDKLYAFRYFISGQAVPFNVLKATTTELIGPKRKHLNYLVSMTNEPNVSVPSIAKHLMLRAKHFEWPVAFKAAITIHHLITYGNAKFIQNLASSTTNHRSLDSLCLFIDRSTALSQDMSIYLRRYTRYIKVKIQTYRSLGVDFCRTDQNSLIDAGERLPNVQSKQLSQAQLFNMKTMPVDQLLKTIPILQLQFDTLLGFDASVEDLCNGVINFAFAMLYKDFVKLYITYQTAIIRLLELLFATRQVKKAAEMLQLYKKFLVSMSKVSDLMRTVDMIGMDKSDMPNFSRSPNNLSLQMLEQHLERLESQQRQRRLSSIHEPIERMQSLEMSRPVYCTPARPRQRSLRRNFKSYDSAHDVLSPVAVMNHKKRMDELRHLDRILGFDEESRQYCDISEQEPTQDKMNGSFSRKNDSDTQIGANSKASIDRPTPSRLPATRAIDHTILNSIDESDLPTIKGDLSWLDDFTSFNEHAKSVGVPMDENSATSQSQLASSGRQQTEPLVRIKM